MRKAIFLLGGAILLLPFVGLADTGGSASATLTLNAVVSVSVTDNWDDLTIKQEDIAGWGAGTVIDWDADSPDITVLIKAITNFVLYGCYYADVNEGDFGNADDLIIINDGSTDFVLPYYKIDYPKNYDGPYTDLKELFEFTDDNNIADDGTTLSYDVKLKPENLGDRAADETITFTIVFVVEEKNL